MNLQRRKFLKWARLFCLSACMLFTFRGNHLALAAGTEESRHEWDKLPESEKALLKERWEAYNKLGPAAQAELRRGYAFFQTLSPEQRRLVDSAYDQWKLLSAAEKASIEEKFVKWKALSPEQQAAVRLEVQRALRPSGAKPAK